MARQWFPWYPGDYQRDTLHLNNAQDLAYRRLIDAYYMAGGLPSDDEQLANIARMSFDDWMKSRAVIKAFFHDGWRHTRMDAEMQRCDAIHAKRAAAGSKGGQVTALNNFKNRFRSKK